MLKYLPITVSQRSYAICFLRDYTEELLLLLLLRQDDALLPVSELYADPDYSPSSTLEALSSL